VREQCHVTFLPPRRGHFRSRMSEGAAAFAEEGAPRPPRAVDIFGWGLVHLSRVKDLVMKLETEAETPAGVSESELSDTQSVDRSQATSFHYTPIDQTGWNSKKHPGFRILLCFALFALFVGPGSAARIVRSGMGRHRQILLNSRCM
jgi:hypothetical protein